MPRGCAAKDGDTFVNQNGYHHTRVDGKWRPTAHIIAEEKLGRPINKETEIVRFIDGDRGNLEPDNITVQPRPNKRSKEARIAVLQSRIADLEAELKLLIDE
jgi:chaperonin GroEL (HSP60 family)